MAYDKHTWTCDEPITVERLNHIEDGIANAGGDCGYECEEEWVTLTEETVTTTEQGGDAGAQLSYSQFIDAETIIVTFDGVEYECPRMTVSDSNAYGGVGQSGPDYSEYPFAIASNGAGGNIIYTQTAGTYTIKIEGVETTVTTTSCFDKARGYSCEEIIDKLTEESVTTELEGSVAYGELSYSQPIDADSITVTFDGVEYECPRLSDDTYGAPYIFSTDTFDWSEYPFHLYSYSSDGNAIQTETAGTYTVKIEALKTNATITSCFEAAVKEANKGMDSVSVASRGYTPKTVVLSPSQSYSVPANSSTQILFTNHTMALSELATIHAITLPDGIVMNSIDFDTAPDTWSIYMGVRNVTGSDITVSVSNANITFVDWREATQVCVMASDGCSSPGPSPK